MFRQNNILTIYDSIFILHDTETIFRTNHDPKYILIEQIKNFPDNTMIGIRGRDSINDLWVYGKAVKNGEFLKIVYTDFDKEEFQITQISWGSLIQPQITEKAHQSQMNGVTKDQIENLEKYYKCAIC